MGVAQARSLADLRQQAMRRLPSSVFHFFDGGAEDELTLSDNRTAFGRQRLWPKVLLDVDRVDMAATILGASAGAPLIVAPMGGVNTTRPGADLMIAKAAAQAGIPYTLSTMATTSIEDIARTVAGRLWFQLYMLRDEDRSERLVRRAEACGYEALVLAVDAPVAASAKEIRCRCRCAGRWPRPWTS